MPEVNHGVVGNQQPPTTTPSCDIERGHSVPVLLVGIRTVSDEQLGHVGHPAPTSEFREPAR